MTVNERMYFALLPGVDVVLLGGDGILFHSDAVSTRVQGEEAVVFATQIVPLLDGRRSLQDLSAHLPHLPVAELRAHLCGLVDAHILSVSSRPKSLEPDETGGLSLVSAFEGLGLDRPEYRSRLQAARVGIFGLEGHGADLAFLLGRAGVGGLRLIDPFPCLQRHANLNPLLAPDSVGLRLENAVSRSLEALRPGLTVDVSGERELGRESIRELASACNLLIGCFDRGFIAAHHWVNRASLELGIPALYGECRGYACVAGPLVIPQQTACFMCYRMRRVACADDFEIAMTYEEFLDKKRQPSLHKRPALPGITTQLANVMAFEVLRVLTGFTPPVLAGNVIEFNALDSSWETHHVLRKPDCAVCHEKKKAGSTRGFVKSSRRPTHEPTYSRTAPVC